MKTILLVCSFLLITCNVSFSKKDSEYNLIDFIPPNGVPISANYFIDRTEITNFNWQEYRYWNKKIFGEDSEEYKATEPTAGVWSKLDPGFAPYDIHYYDHTAYQNYPVVGVSQNQAMMFSKWRSDRVLEFILIKLGQFEYDANQNPVNHFTIDKYFNGEYKGIQPDGRIEYYPAFRLPLRSELTEITILVDSLNSMRSKRNSKNCAECFARYPPINSSSNLDSLLMVVSVTRPVDLACCLSKGWYVFDLRGNVAEWITETNLTFGRGWYYNPKDSADSQISRSETPNCWTGFRNICEWKKWKE